ncbi:iron-siderophore ABC transporter substrate-binding protein [Pseudooceanicola marinus]|uniref:iron-siderophore ABC transporter substrate-binding protein n=1 Tax=Pseudooceanicola marinus TaxID=396013 RepID=UPI001CD52229|nr:iron-siderophore ABC transporter substrate-binding protein [Pseudooceanicola marinus]MCA1334573.1 iron-siderophore ABC transporter substrate-binding protein [Pseudooceanicola marinus]
MRLSRRALCLSSLALGLTALAPGAMAQEFPLRVAHAYGETVIPARPQRVATVSWANHEVPLALGVVPVGMAAANFGDADGDGLLPWVKAALDELGAEVPRLYDEGDGIDFEAVAATQPDVILAAYSGLSRQDYDTLSMIAPVVAFPEGPWATGWRDMIRLNAAGMGMAEEGTALIDRIEGEIAATRAAHPEFEGKTAMFVTHLAPTDLSRISFYTDNDPRVRFFHDLGLTSPAFIAETAESGAFAGEISAERIDLLDDVDLLVTYGGEDLRAGLAENALTAHLPAVAKGGLVLLGNDAMGTAANPTPLSLPWVLDDYAAQLSAALAGAE